MELPPLDPPASAGSSLGLKEYAARQLNAVLWLSLISVTVLLLREVLRLLRLWAKGARIPGPPCPSFYGHSVLFSGPDARENLLGLVSKSHERYGSVVKLWLGPSQLLVSIRDPTLVKEMLSKAGDKSPLTARAFRLAFGRLNLFATSFDKVHRGRALLEMEFNKKLSQTENVTPTKTVSCVMERLHGVLAAESTSRKFLSQRMAFAILGTILFGEAFLASPKAVTYEELLMKIAKDACIWASYCVVPFWKQGFWRYQVLCKKLKCLTQDVINQCRQNYKLFFRMDQRLDFGTANFRAEAAPDVPTSSGGVKLSDFLPGELDGYHDLEEPCGDMMGLMLHGCLSTAGLICSILSRLAAHPEIQDKIYKEVIMVQKELQKQGHQDVEKMHLLMATIYESARLLPPGPLLQRCSIRNDLNLDGGVIIPAGAIVVVPVQLVQTDSSSWGGDASQFNPYRFLLKAEKKSDCLLMKTAADEHAGRSSFVLTNPNENAAYLPFGSGIRACVGQKIAIFGIAMLFASLLEDYEIRLLEGHAEDQTQIANDSFLQHLSSPEVTFVRRDPVKF